MELMKDRMPETVHGKQEISGEGNMKILDDLGRHLEYKDLVILIDIKNSEYLTGILCESGAIRETKKQLAVLSTTEFPRRAGKHIYCKISEREMEELIELYRSYEASDKLVLFSYDLNYGSMWNYIKSGLINQEEMLQAVLA